MRKAMVLLLAVIALGGVFVHAGERPTVNFELAEIHGYFLHDETDQIAYVTNVHFAEKRVEVGITIRQRTADGSVVTADFQPQTLQSVAEEAQLYWQLAQRGRKFAETIPINSAVGLDVSSNGEFSMTITVGEGEGKAFVYAGAKAGQVIDNLTNATAVADRWVQDILCAGVAPGRPPRAAASERPRVRRESAPAMAPAASDGQFVATEVSVRNSSLPGITEIQGRLANNSGRNLSIAVFKMSFFDADDKLIGAADIMMQDFKAGETATFDAMTDTDFAGWARYEVRLDSAF